MQYIRITSSLETLETLNNAKHILTSHFQTFQYLELQNSFIKLKALH